VTGLKSLKKFTKANNTAEDGVRSRPPWDDDDDDDDGG